MKNKLIKNKINTNNFKKFITKFIRFNDILYNKVMKKKYKNSHKRFEIYVKKTFVKNTCILKIKIKFTLKLRL